MTVWADTSASLEYKIPHSKSWACRQGLTLTWSLPRTMLRQLRPQGLRMTCVWPRSKPRPLLQTKLRPQRRRADASLAACFRRGPHLLPMRCRLPNDAEAAPAADGKAAPAAVAKAAAAAQLLLARLLASKAENICRKFLDAGSFLAQVPRLKYCVAWESTLGKGTWGTVHKGFRTVSHGRRWRSKS